MSNSANPSPMAYALAEAMQRRASDIGRDALTLAAEVLLQNCEPEAMAWLQENYPELMGMGKAA